MSGNDGIVGWRWLDVRLRERARRQVRAEPAPSRRRRAATAALAAVVQVAAFATLLCGAWLCTVRFPSVALLPGVVLLLFGVLTLPRPATMPRDAVAVRRADAPALHALTDRVADALGVPRPHVVVLDDRFAADSGFAGFLRRRYLRIGAPLWAVLDPAQRAALVALELARFGGGDPSRAALTGTVERTLATMVAVLEPAADKRMQTGRDNDVVKMISANPGQRVGEEQASTNLAEDLIRPFIALLQGAFGLVRLGYLTLLQPDAFRAVLAADARAAAAAGTADVRSVLATRLLAESMVTVLRRDARAGDRSSAVRRDEPETVVAGWPALAAAALAENLPLLPDRCDADVARNASPFAVTPPLGRRIEVLADVPGTLAADPEESAETDVELRPMYRRLVRDLRNG
ncbi:M48 family metallopeptidase [Dactylosporangium aurantiacum]|uniref:M48 family metallopeptidase n=1 Tax=Dactylosporangium aurantiacum TaxID=35754 RepID=A0A9Q9IRD4_9ACTN|nr:M48 family metallopeptidase [Dactylosporangium aurantiacum]MDG6110025.1 M48 family metallopeptidase [Dactylosporangium aurantiacum]UWZ58417.1 M48 family metallopeptidase [Dactylosporangium aurantiacum]